MKDLRVNGAIRGVYQVVVIDSEGENKGLMSIREAGELARQSELDLVEVSPGANPVVCKLLDYGKFKYEQSKKEKAAKASSAKHELHEVRMQVKCDIGDRAVKAKKIDEFLADKDDVKISIRFKGREMAHPEIGQETLKKILEVITVPFIEKSSRSMNGKMLSLTIGAKAS